MDLEFTEASICEASIYIYIYIYIYTLVAAAF